MTARSLKTRIAKLEESRKRIDEMLVVWRLPSADIESALAGARYVPGDRVICMDCYMRQLAIRLDGLIRMDL